VAAVDVDSGALDTWAEQSPSAHLRVFPADVSDEHLIATAVGAAAAEWGGLDIVVAVAGIEPIDVDTYLHELDAGVLLRVVDVNLSEWH
jgi:NAD(P)-dependent dehydrogenase (short-subunit alcohol dehydrogenase family)